MAYPMRRYGPTVQEAVLADVLAGLGLLMAALGIAAAIWPDALLPDATLGGGILAAGTSAAGLLLALAGAGLRQNRAALDVGQAFALVAALAWLLWGGIAGRTLPIVAGGALALAWVGLTLLRRSAVRARFKPRFFSPRAFETMVQIADTMIDGDGREVLDPIDVAVHTDHLLDDVRSPATDELKLVMILVEYGAAAADLEAVPVQHARLGPAPPGGREGDRRLRAVPRRGPQPEGALMRRLLRR